MVTKAAESDTGANTRSGCTNCLAIGISQLSISPCINIAFKISCYCCPFCNYNSFTLLFAWRILLSSSADTFQVS